MKRILFLFTIIALINVINVEAKPKIAISKIELSSTPRDFYEGMAIVSQQTSDGKTCLFGAIDRNGKLVIPYKYSKMSDFRDGVSIVTSDEGTGIINKKGQYILKPNVNYSIYPEKLPKRYLRNEMLVSGLYRVCDSSTKKYGYFYQNRMVVPITEEGYRTSIYFPFICFNNNNKDSCGLVNVETGEKFKGRIDHKLYIIRIQYKDAKGQHIVRYFDEESGDELFISNTSKNGVEIIKDENDKDYIKDHDQTFLKGEDFKCYTYGWLNNIVTFLNLRGRFVAFNGQGKRILDVAPKDNDIVVVSVYPSKKSGGNGAIVECQYTHLTDNDMTFHGTLYDGNGNKIYENNHLNFLAEDWYYCLNTKTHKGEIVHTAPFKVYPIKGGEPVCCDGMIIIQDDLHTYTIINTETGKMMSGLKYSKIHPYNEGIAIAEVSSSYQKVALNKEGREVLRNCSEYSIVTDKASEGVIAVHFSNGTYGYISTDASKNSYQDPFAKGLELFKQGKYAKAKNLFYNVMINDPNNVDAIVNYGSCLERLGYYDSAIDAFMTALRIDPNNKLAKENLEITKSNKILAAEYRQQQAQQAEMFFDGLSQFLNILGETYTQYASFSNEMNNARNSGYSSSSNYSSSHNTKGQTANENISKNRDARTYSDLETQLIKMNTNYNTYNDNQRRSIQSQMHSIRTKWEQRGYQMFHSTWEDWDGRKR